MVVAKKCCFVGLGLVLGVALFFAGRFIGVSCSGLTKKQRCEVEKIVESKMAQAIIVDYQNIDQNGFRPHWITDVNELN